MQSVVKGRHEANTYLDKLGVVYQAKKDLDRLSQSMMNKYNDERPKGSEVQEKEKTDEEETQTKPLFPRGRPRILLFVDDLDRCDPDNVIDVLEALQLLVKTNLFVVIVAIDPRYVCRSLETRKYLNILKSNDSPTGMDFLEKIIQIPYRPLALPDTMGQYIGQQIGIFEGSNVNLSGNQGGNKENGSEIDSPEGRRDENLNKRQSDKESIPKQPVTTICTKDYKNDNFSQQQFSQEEANLLNEACASLKLLPRSIKRVVNVFKIMKLIWRKSGDVSEDLKKQSLMLLVLGSCEEAKFKMQELFAFINQGQFPTEGQYMKDDDERKPTNLKDLIKSYVYKHNEDTVDKLSEGLEQYSIGTNEDLLKISKAFQLAISFSFFRVGMDNDSKET